MVIGRGVIEVYSSHTQARTRYVRHVIYIRFNQSNSSKTPYLGWDYLILYHGNCIFERKIEYSVILSPNDSSIIASEIHLASIGSSGSLAKLIILGIYIYSIWRILNSSYTIGLLVLDNNTLMNT
ncbi:unnamed protein product [Rhizophagus irregularis]|nr:unnamed protein product [Rhizophagus irregularis]